MRAKSVAEECDAMRVLQVLHDRERGGVQRLAATIEDSLRPHGGVFETAYLYPRPDLSAGAKVVCILAMARRILAGGFDALMAYQGTASVLVGVVGWLRGCRLRIVHQTCTPSGIAAPVRFLDRWVGTLGFYTVNIANSAATWAEFDSYPARYRRAMALIEHGLDPQLPTCSRQEARRRFTLPPERPILLNVGRLVPQKNQDILIRALAGVPKAHLVVAGGGVNEEEYRALAATLGVADRLHLLGEIEPQDIPDLYAAADAFVFPSTWETFGLAAFEAAMVGVPLVVGDLAVLREVLSTAAAQPTVFVDPHDLPGWISAISAALAAPPAPRVLAEYAHAMARKYSRDRMIESYVALLAPPARAAAPLRPRQEVLP
jgi:glycosyltransferase involved in cell wall biosynthesis